MTDEDTQWVALNVVSGGTWWVRRRDIDEMHRHEGQTSVLTKHGVEFVIETPDKILGVE